MPEYIQAFDEQEMLDATGRFARLVKALQGRKLEEDDWTALYCDVKKAPHPGWSNLPFRDYIHNGVGVEFKLLKRGDPTANMGSWIMHPAATRRINFDESSDADVAMAKVFSDWNQAIDEFEQRVRLTSPTGEADLRWGVLLWAEDHSEFLYFEERLEKPDVKNYVARWHDGQHRGQATRNLHILDRVTGEKRFSCTLPRNGAKLQPYFRVPTIEEGAHLFRPERHNTVPLFVQRDDLDRLLALFPDREPEDAISEMLTNEQNRRR